MKKIVLLLISCYYMAAMGQNLISPISITLPANPPASTAAWATAMPPVIITAQTKLQNGQVNGTVIESKILVTIKQGGSKVCGSYTQQTAPASGFNTATKTWSGASVLQLLGQDCTLKPGSYELCVQFYSMAGTQASRLLGESCKSFTIPDSKQENFTPPTNISPAKNQQLKKTEAKGPITFRWTPIIPKPQQQIVYRLKVWQLMQGQNAAQAIKSNQPIVIKDVENQTQFVKPNLMGDVEMVGDQPVQLVWNVEAIGRDAAQSGGKSFGVSEPTAFSVGGSPECHLEFTKNIKDSITVVCKGTNPATGGNIYNVCTWLYNKNNSSSNSLTVTSLTSLIASNIISGVTPAFNFTIPAGGSQKICFDITVPASQTKIKVKAFSNFAGTNGEDCTSNPISDSIPLTPCRCTTCDQVQWRTPELIKYDTSTFRGTNNIMTLYGNIYFGPQKIIKLSAEIIDFYWYTEGDCKKCNSNDYYFGNLVSGSATGLTATSVADESGIPLSSSHQIDFLSPTLSGVTLNTPIALNISLPPQTQLSCCTDCFRFCIRYTATFMENGVCKTCTIVKCYESKRKHRKNGMQQWPQPNQCGDVVFPPKGDAILIDGVKQK